MTLELGIRAANILIVDDEDASLHLLRRMLTEAGYTHVTATNNPFEVCALHRQHDYDLILLDLQMPGMDGFSVMEGLKALDKDSYTPVIALTAQPQHKLRALRAGAKDFISKPFDLLEAKTRILNVLEVRMLYRKLEETVRERTAELSELASYLITVREDEKALLARELHDELGALLTVAKIDVARLRVKLREVPALAVHLDPLDRHLDDGIALKRRIIETLRPSGLAVLGLTQTLESLATDGRPRLNIAIQTEFDEVELTDEGQLAIYRLVQEALTNVSKYANASCVNISVKNEPPVVRVRIDDNGIGFDLTTLNSSTHGIAGMRFRFEKLKGSLTIDSRPGAGTRLDATVPMAVAAAVASPLRR